MRSFTIIERNSKIWKFILCTRSSMTNGFLEPGEEGEQEQLRPSDDLATKSIHSEPTSSDLALPCRSSEL